PITAGAIQSTTPGGTSAFVAKLDTSGSTGGGASLLYGTYLGSGTTYGNAIAVDTTTTGQIYVTGSTRGGIPTRNPYQGNLAGFQNAFVSTIAITSPTTSALVYSTYLGGMGYDAGNAIATDAQGEAFVVGSTTSGASFPTYQPFQTTGLSSASNV